MSWNMLLPIITTLGGAYISTSANKKAGEQIAASQREGAAVTADAIRQGNAQAQQTLDQIRTEGAPARSYLQSVVADPGTLTPAQKTQLDELRMGVTNTINSSPFAGSGRTAAQLFRKTESDFVNDALERNRDRAFTAATGLSGQSTNAATAIANSQANSGAAIGKVEGEAIQKGGMYEAQGDLASANVMGKAIGDIGSTIASEARESRYADRLKKIERSLGIS